MATCVAEGLEQGHSALTSSTALLTQLVQAEATDRATRSIRYQMHVARFPIHRDLAGFDFEQAKVDRRQITSFCHHDLHRASGEHRPDRRDRHRKDAL